MITIENQQKRVIVTVIGEFTLADYQEFEEQVNYKLKFEGEVDLLFDFREMAGATLDVAWEEVKFARKHASDFGRIAILTDDQWVTWSAWISQLFVDAHVLVFDDYAAAVEWLNSPEDVAS